MQVSGAYSTKNLSTSQMRLMRLIPLLAHLVGFRMKVAYSPFASPGSKGRNVDPAESGRKGSGGFARFFLQYVLLCILT